MAFSHVAGVVNEFYQGLLKGFQESKTDFRSSPGGDGFKNGDSPGLEFRDHLVIFAWSDSE